ncbi:hypothetical protein HELRODRAFT_169357 [Helobdella robusta]|uniref:Uncharacterized protein n=1 Tax=Helobdella robusta TaxID=6412 RepID=T1F1U1_HELRO|nr:hypothetical protein HELRODRAFT_169357 [Helobdella robusta]ESO08500.1 hypothetical protein HELRODRAFT_169357 [Helobdella robusta]
MASSYQQAQAQYALESTNTHETFVPKTLSFNDCVCVGLHVFIEKNGEKEDAMQLLLGSNFNLEKFLELINSSHRSTMPGIEPQRGRMLRGKSVIETATDYNQTFAVRGASAFQPPQQPFFNNQNLVSQQLQQQMLLQKVGLLGAGNAPAGMQHARSSSMVPKLDSSLFNSGSNNKNQQIQQLQTLLQLQSVLQPLLVERAQLQQNTVIPAPQKKNRLEVLNMDIFKVKALIDQLQLYGHTGAPTSSLSSSALYNQSDPTGVEEARLLQALGQLKLDQISPTSCTSSLLSNSSVTADLVSLLQNTAGVTHSINSWLPNMCSGADNFGHGQSKDGWNMLHHGKSSTSFGGMYPPPPPGLNSSDKMGGGYVGQPGPFSRSTSWAPGEKIKTGPPHTSQICWFLIKNTSVVSSFSFHYLLP